MAHFRLFYQNSAGYYHPYIIDFMYNYCEWSQLMQSGSKLFELFRTFQLTTDQGLDQGKPCPFNVIFVP